MLQGEHSAIPLTFIKLPFVMQVKSIAECFLTFIKLLFVIKIFVLSIFEWPFYTGFTVYSVVFYILSELLIFSQSSAIISLSI